MSKYVLIDIGGTSIKTTIYEDGFGEVREVATEASKGAQHLIETVKKIVEDSKDIQAIGICTAGQVDAFQGKIIYANENLPGYTGTCWKEILEEAYHVPVFVENDVNAAALGEGSYGAAQGVKNYLCLTYGTGVGGAIVLDGNLYRGITGSAAEFGALLTHAEMHEEGKAYSGSYEAYASTSALIRKAREVDPTLKNGRELFDKVDNLEMMKVVDDWVNEIAIGLCSFIHIFNPEMVILGGGVMERDFVFDKVKEKVHKEIMDSYKDVKLMKAALGNKAGMYGCLARINNEIKV